MTTKYNIFSIAAALALAPVALAAPNEATPGKESTATTAPVTKTEPAAVPAVGSVATAPKADGKDIVGKRSTTTSVPVAGQKESGISGTPTTATKTEKAETKAEKAEVAEKTEKK